MCYTDMYAALGIIKIYSQVPYIFALLQNNIQIMHIVSTSNQLSSLVLPN